MIKTLFRFPVDVVCGVSDFLAAQWKQFTPMGQGLFAVAVVMVLVDAAISFKFGLTQTWVHAIGFAGLAFAFFLLPDAAVSEVRKKNFVGGIGLGAACIPLFAVCLWTHVGYSSGVRLGDIEQSGYSKASYKSADTALKDKRATLAMLTEKHKGVLGKQADALTRNKGWTVSVDPQAMQAQLAAIDSKIANEAKRVRCGTKCDELKVERGNLSAAIALAKEENELAAEIKALEAQIEAKVGEVAALAPKTSSTVSQVQMAAKLVNTVAYYSGVGTEEQVLNPSAFQQDIANTAAAGISSLAFLIVGATLMMGAGCNRKPGALTGEAYTEHVSEIGNRNPEPRAYSPPIVSRATNAMARSTAYTSGPVLLKAA